MFGMTKANVSGTPAKCRSAVVANHMSVGFAREHLSRSRSSPAHVPVPVPLHIRLPE